MPPRLNPHYVGGGNSYSSRGLAPNYTPTDGGVASALGQMAGMAIQAATYDPALDPRAQQARLAGAQADKLAAEGKFGEWFGSASGNPAVRFGDIASQAARLNVDPETIGKYGRVLAAVQGLAPGQTNDQWMAAQDPVAMASGVNPSASWSAATYDNRMKPVSVVGADGRPKLVPANEAVGMPPVLNKSEVEGMMLGDLAATMTPGQKLRTVGAEPLSEQVLNYSGPDGAFGSGPASKIPTGPGYIAFSGQAQGGVDSLRPTVRGQLQSQAIANQQFNDMLGMAEGIAMRDPTLFGTTGNVRRFAQNLWQQVANTQQLAPGTSLVDAYADSAAKAQQNGISLLDPTQYDPALADIVTMSELLVFGAAEALANQQGRSVSDKDVQLFRSIVGDPTAWTSSQEQFLSKINLVRTVLNMKQERIAGALGGSLGDMAGSLAGSPAPQAAPQASPEAELPPGAVLLPDGRAQMPDGTILRWVP